MPNPKNLIAIKQIRQDELSGFALTIASGYVQQYVSGVSGELLSYINLVSGNLQDQIDEIIDNGGGGGGGTGTGAGGTTMLSFNVPVASGVDTIHCLYGQTVTPYISVASFGTTSASDPIIVSMLTTRNATGQVVELSQATSSANYYLNLLIPL